MNYEGERRKGQHRHPPERQGRDIFVACGELAITGAAALRHLLGKNRSRSTDIAHSSFFIAHLSTTINIPLS
jgi:hypothetical protein